MTGHETAPMPRRYATVAKAAEYSGVSEKTIRRHIDAGTLTGYRMGTRILRVDLGEIDQLMAATAQTSRNRRRPGDSRQSGALVPHTPFARTVGRE